MVTYDYVRMFLGHEVVIHCRDGGVITGVITEVTPGYIGLQTNEIGQRNNGYGGYGYDGGYGGAGFGVGPAVTALALYNILAISLFAW